MGVRSNRHPSDSRSVDTDESNVDLYAVVEGRARPKPSTSSLHDAKLSALEKRLANIEDERRPVSQSRVPAQVQVSERTGKEIKRIDNRRRKSTNTTCTDGINNNSFHGMNSSSLQAPSSSSAPVNPSLTKECFMDSFSNRKLYEHSENHNNELSKSARSCKSSPMVHHRRSSSSAVQTPQSEKESPEMRRTVAITAGRVDLDQHQQQQQQRSRSSHMSNPIHREEEESQQEKIKQLSRSESFKDNSMRRPSRPSTQETPSRMNDVMVQDRARRGSSRTMVPPSILIHREEESEQEEIKQLSRSESFKYKSIHRRPSGSTPQETPSRMNDVLVQDRARRGSSRTLVPPSAVATDAKSKSTSAAMHVSKRRPEPVEKTVSTGTMDTVKPEVQRRSSLFARKSSSKPEPTPTTNEQRKVHQEIAYIDSLFRSR